MLIPGGSMILTPAAARILYQELDIGHARSRHRVGNDTVYRLLTDISLCAFQTDADIGNEPRQNAASEEREWWTTEQLATATRRSPRTIRNDLATGALPGVKNRNGWSIRADHARTYIEGHRRTR